MSGEDEGVFGLKNWKKCPFELQNRCSTTELNWHRRTYFLRGGTRFGKISNRAGCENRIRHAVNYLFVSRHNRREDAPKSWACRVAVA